MAHIRRFDHVGITVADLERATAFFVALGLEVEGRANPGDTVGSRTLWSRPHQRARSTSGSLS